jgi:hypothetical protein
MEHLSLLRRLVTPTIALTIGLHAAQVEITNGLITGAHFNTRLGLQEDGIHIDYPVWDWIQNKEYTYRVVGYSHTDKDESYVGLGPTREYGFANGTATGLGDVEVGVDNSMRLTGGGIAVSRYNFRIKNNLDEPIAYLFEFYIRRGLLEVDGIRSDHTLHARVEASIDYTLLTPAGPFGGHYDETSGNLFNYFADIGFDSRMTHSSNANVTLLQKDDFKLSYLVDPYHGKLWLPDIPAHGELTVYYDMYSHLNVQRFEIGGRAMLGDPNDLSRGPGIRLTQASETPEPSTIVLLASGCLSIGLRKAICRFRAA